MEIITYVINGELTHKDSLGNIETLTRGNVQYLSAGDGIYHSEHNLHKFENLHLLQMWIVPPQKGLSRLYGSHKFLDTDRKNKLLNIVSSNKGLSPIKIYQDVNFFVSELEKEKTLNFKISKNRQIYFVQIEGDSLINEIELNSGDAAEITSENNLHIKALGNSHFLFIEMSN
jgi:redox-sensitive bicupin YhaK (pirin superfamily)